MSQRDSQSAPPYPTRDNRGAQDQVPGQVMMIRLLITTVVLTAVAWILGGFYVWHQAQQLSDLEDAWVPNQATYERLVSARQDLTETRRTLSELAGSWKCPIHSGSLIGAVSLQAPDQVEIGKIRIESTLTYDQPASVTHVRDVPFHEVSMTVAGRCYAEDASARILDFQHRLQQDGAVASRFNHIALEGTQYIESRGEESLPSHTVFAVRLDGSPHPLILGESTP